MEISKKDLVNFILQNRKVSDTEIISSLYSPKVSAIPSTVFTTAHSPLEAISNYLKMHGMKINEIAQALNKQSPSICEALKNSRSKPFKVRPATIHIPLSEFTSNKKLSILETVVQYLRDNNLRLVDIAKLLKRNPKTIWTLYNRSKNK